MSTRKPKRKPTKLKADTNASVMLGDLVSYADDVEDVIGDLLDVLALIDPRSIDPRQIDPQAASESVVDALVKLRMTWNWLSGEARRARNAAIEGGVA